jgi:hypothetical protein
MSRWDADKHLDNLPRTHPREQLVREAERDLEDAFTETVKKHELTNGEQLRVLASVFGNRVARVAKYAIRHERHGRGDKPGGLT